MKPTNRLKLAYKIFHECIDDGTHVSVMNTIKKTLQYLDDEQMLLDNQPENIQEHAMITQAEEISE